jgi:hypothetical protein
MSYPLGTLIGEYPGVTAGGGASQFFQCPSTAAAAI